MLGKYIIGNKSPKVEGPKMGPIPWGAGARRFLLEISVRELQTIPEIPDARSPSLQKP